MFTLLFHYLHKIMRIGEEEGVRGQDSYYKQEQRQEDNRHWAQCGTMLKISVAFSAWINFAESERGRTTEPHWISWVLKEAIFPKYSNFNNQRKNWSSQFVSTGFVAFWIQAFKSQRQTISIDQDISPQTSGAHYCFTVLKMIKHPKKSLFTWVTLSPIYYILS